MLPERIAFRGLELGYPVREMSSIPLHDPLEPPDPEEWLLLDESERIELVERHHRRAKERVPNLTLHAAIHAVVETQSALGGETPVRRTLERLQSEGLDRHDAVHAVGSVLAAHMVVLMKGDLPGEGSSAVYEAQVEALTAEGWKRSFLEQRPSSP